MQRITGVDVARGLAVLGMLTAHVGPGGPDDPWPWSLAQVVDGRSAALFVLLSGISVALISGGSAPVAVILLGTPIAVILPTYAVLFACATPLLGAAPRRLLGGAAAVAAFGPPLHLALQEAFLHLPGREFTDLLVGDFYPAVVWLAYVLVGLAVGRMDLRDRGVRLRLLGAGVLLAVAAHAASALLTRALAGDPTLVALVTTEPHSSSGLEVVANTGVGLAVLALCLIVADAVPALVAPLAATGALALTAYTAQLVAIAALGDAVVWEPDAGTWVAFLVVTVLACWLWRAALGRGPLERLLHTLAARAADVSPDVLPPRDAVPAARD